MKEVIASAPGKLMLFGEHAVVYNRPAIVTAVDQRMRATVSTTENPILQLEAADVKVTGYKKSLSDLGQGEVPKGAQFVETAVQTLFESHGLPGGLKVETSSEFSSEFGFGSSSASTVCTVKAVSELYGLDLSDRQIFDVAFKTVLTVQGKGSGFDVAAAVYGGTLYFVTGGKTIDPLAISNLPLVVGYSGIKADTVTLINAVKEKFADDPKRLEEIYSEIAAIVEEAKVQILSGNWKETGRLMSDNQLFLKELGVSIDKLDEMISGAVSAGAYGAKLSGAGGGDCIIAVGPEEDKEAMERGIENAGGRVLNVRTNAEGVRIE